MADASARRPPAGPEPELLAGPGTITAIAGLTFVISDELGDIGQGPFGLMARDTRHLSRLEVRVDGERLAHLGAGLLRPEAARFRGYVLLSGAYPDAPLESERVRAVQPDGFDEELRLRWWAPGEIAVEVGLALAADFADIFEVRRLGGSRRPTRAGSEIGPAPGELRFVGEDGRRRTGVRLQPPPDRVEDGRCLWTARVRRGQPWRISMAVRASAPPARPVAGGRVHRLHPERTSPVAVSTEPDDLAMGCRRSLGD